MVQVPSSRWRVVIKQPSDADSQGKPLPCGDLGDPQVEDGCRLLRVGVRAPGGAFRARVVQTPPPPGWGGPRWLFSRLASGVSACHHTRSALLGAVPGRFVRDLVCCPACDRVPVICGGAVFSPRPQGGVIALEVCLAGYREGFPRGVPCRLCMIASWHRLATSGSQGWVCVGGAPAGRHEGVESVVIAAVSAGPRPPAGCAWVCQGLKWAPGSVPPRTLRPLVCPCRFRVLAPWMERRLRDTRSEPHGRAVGGGGWWPARRPASVPQVLYRVGQCPVPCCFCVPRCAADDWLACWRAGCPAGPSPRYVSPLWAVPGRLGPPFTPVLLSALGVPLYLPWPQYPCPLRAPRLVALPALGVARLRRLLLASPHGIGHLVRVLAWAGFPCGLRVFVCYHFSPPRKALLQVSRPRDAGPPSRTRGPVCSPAGRRLGRWRAPGPGPGPG